MNRSEADKKREPSPLERRVKHACVDLGIELPELADRAGVSYDHLRRILRRQNEPRSSTLIRLMKATGIPASELIQLMEEQQEDA